MSAILITHMLAVANISRTAPAEPIITDDQLLAVICIAALPLIIIGVSLLIALNRRRYLAVAPSMAWLSTGYIRNLPNILKMIYDAAQNSPWPAEPTSLHAALYRHRLQKMLRARFAEARELADQHLSLWVFVELHRQDLRELVLRRKIVRLRGLLLNTPDENLRLRLLNKMSRCRQQLKMIQLISPAPARTTDSRTWLLRLKALNALFAEHGFQIDPCLAELEHWQYTRDEELLAEVVTDDAAVALS